jgi:hypothetical protein
MVLLREQGVEEGEQGGLETLVHQEAGPRDPGMVLVDLSASASGGPGQALVSLGRGDDALSEKEPLHDFPLPEVGALQDAQSEGAGVELVALLGLEAEPVLDGGVGVPPPGVGHRTALRAAVMRALSARSRSEAFSLFSATYLRVRRRTSMARTAAVMEFMSFSSELVFGVWVVQRLVEGVHLEHFIRCIPVMSHSVQVAEVFGVLALRVIFSISFSLIGLSMYSIQPG